VFDAEGVERDQIAAADVLLLSKADTATPDERSLFETKARQSFPPKRWIGVGDVDALSTTALNPPADKYEFMLPARPDAHVRAHVHAHEVHSKEREALFGKHAIAATEYLLLDRRACGWTIPREATFNRVKLVESLQQGAEGLLPDIERLKAVLRTGIDHWTLFNVATADVNHRPCGWRQDSRIEVQAMPGADVDWTRWDRYWQSMLAK